MTDAEKAHNGIEIDGSRAAGKPPPVVEIAADVEVWKKECILKYVADAPLMPRQVDAAFRIDEDRAVDADAATVGADEPGDQVEYRRFAGARRPEERGYARAGAQRDIEGETAARQKKARLDHVNPAAR